MRLLRRALKTVLRWRLGRVPPTSASRVALAEPEATLLAEYMYQNLARPTCGEQAMTTLVSPGSARAQVVGRALGPRLVANPPQQPVSFICGEADWMDVRNAHPLVEAGAAFHVATLPTSGHHVGRPGRIQRGGTACGSRRPGQRKPCSRHGEQFVNSHMRGNRVYSCG